MLSILKKPLPPQTIAKSFGPPVENRLGQGVFLVIANTQAPVFRVANLVTDPGGPPYGHPQEISIMIKNI